MDDEATKPKGELLRIAKRLGATEREFDRWRRAGLLPQPSEIRRLGYGRGSLAIYPPHTSGQLRRLCELHFGSRGVKPERRLLFLAWKLWWEGHEVDLARVRMFLTKHVAPVYDGWAETVRTMTGEERRQVAHEFATARRLGSRGWPRSRARGHLRGQTPRFVELLLAMLDGEDIVSRPADVRLLEKAVGMQPGRLLVEEQDDTPRGLLAALAQELTNGTIARSPELMSDIELRDARHLTQLYWGELSAIVGYGRLLLGPKFARRARAAYGDRLQPPQGPREQAAWALCFGALRRIAASNEGVADWLASIVAREFMITSYAQMSAVRKIKPFDTLLSPDAMQRTLSDLTSLRELRRDMRRTVLDEPEAVEAAKKAVQMATKQTREK